jgi:hypothetical protein
MIRGYDLKASDLERIRMHRELVLALFPTNDERVHLRTVWDSPLDVSEMYRFNVPVAWFRGS